MYSGVYSQYNNQNLQVNTVYTVHIEEKGILKQKKCSGKNNIQN